MGTFLECNMEKNFTQLEISEEITKKSEKENKQKNKTNSKNINKKGTRNKKFKNNKKLNNIKTSTINDDDDFIIINTDEEKSISDKENKIKNKNKKINNTIFINNSNVTISQRKEKKPLEEINEIKPDLNYYNSNDDNLELDEILSNVFNNNNRGNSISYNNNKNLFTESDIDYNYNKEYFDQLYSEQSQVKLDMHHLNENDEKIIKKLNKLKEKINNKNKPKILKKSYKRKFVFNPLQVQRTISMANKQIRKNIPSYRKTQGFFNSISFNKNYNLRNFKDNNYSYVGLSNCALGNSFNKSLFNSMMFDSVKENFYSSTNSNKWTNNINATPSIYSNHKSYLNNSSINQNSSNGFVSKYKNKKQKALYNVVTKKIKPKNKSQIKTNRTQKIKKKLIKMDIKKEIENNYDSNENILLYHHYRDIIEIFLPNNFHKESLVDKKIFGISELNKNKNKIILNYNKLNKLSTSIILYDGILYKVNDKKNNGFKLSKRYFQISKNCFKYYGDFDKEKKDIKPLVQFDIRHIKDLQIIENDFLSEYKIENKDIEMVFCIYLNQNDDFFVFAVNNENLGKSVFDILNLLKNYYEDKK